VLPVRWRYEHADLDEPRFPDGTAIRRPVVTVGAPGSLRDYTAVIDSGSPVSAADSRLFASFGIDIDSQQPLFEVPLGLGGSFSKMPVFEVALELRPPLGQSATEVVKWRLQLGARRGWRLPFTVLFGQRGWFDRFPTTIDATTTTIDLFPTGTNRL
jgi:hypothetical protein